MKKACFLTVFAILLTFVVGCGGPKFRKEIVMMDVPERVCDKVQIPVQSVAETGGEKNFLKIGADPVDPKLCEKKKLKTFSLDKDSYVATTAKSRKVSVGWLHKGELIGKLPSGDTVICKCGNFVEFLAEPQSTKETTSFTEEVVCKDIIKKVPKEVIISVPCEERKTGWGRWIGGVVGGGGSLLLGGNRLVTAVAAGGGSLIGSFIDGRCINAVDGVVAAGFGVGGYLLGGSGGGGGHGGGGSLGGHPGTPVIPGGHPGIPIP